MHHHLTLILIVLGIAIFLCDLLFLKATSAGRSFAEALANFQKLRADRRRARREPSAQNSR